VVLCSIKGFQSSILLPNRVDGRLVSLGSIDVSSWVVMKWLQLEEIVTVGRSFKA